MGLYFLSLLRLKEKGIDRLFTQRTAIPCPFSFRFVNFLWVGLLLSLGIVCNVVFAVTVLVTDSVDFNTHILAVFMINLFVYSVFYVIMKMHKREWAFVTHRIYPFLFLLAALVFWLTGSYFFMKKAAKWEVRST